MRLIVWFDAGSFYYIKHPCLVHAGPQRFHCVNRKWPEILNHKSNWYKKRTLMIEVPQAIIIAQVLRTLRYWPVVMKNQYHFYLFFIVSVNSLSVSNFHNKYLTAWTFQNVARTNKTWTNGYRTTIPRTEAGIQVHNTNPIVITQFYIK